MWEVQRGASVGVVSLQEGQERGQSLAKAAVKTEATAAPNTWKCVSQSKQPPPVTEGLILPAATDSRGTYQWTSGQQNKSLTLMSWQTWVIFSFWPSFNRDQHILFCRRLPADTTREDMFEVLKSYRSSVLRLESQ